MRITRRMILALGAFSLAATGAALAHHGWGSYDAQNPVTVRGPIGKLEYANPHVHIDVADGGKTWEIVLAPPSRMQIRGATRDVIKTGTAVTAYGYPSRVNQNEMRAEWIEVAGKRYELR